VNDTKPIMVEGFISDQQKKGLVGPYRYPPDGGLRRLREVHELRPSFALVLEDESKKP